MLREVRPSEAIRAGDHNDVVRAVRRIGAAAGVQFSMPDGGIVGMLPALMPDDAKWARITAYTGPAPDATGGVPAELITYNVALVRGQTNVMTNQRPHLGHPFPDGVKIKPAPVGAPAVILRWTIAGDTQSLLYVFCGRDAEQVVVAECAGGGA
ncbi:MAG: hypothetical protein U0638_01660 [Phycisphaerales bacterium]